MDKNEAVELFKEQYNALWEVLSNHNLFELYPDITECDNELMPQAWKVLEGI